MKRLLKKIIVLIVVLMAIKGTAVLLMRDTFKDDMVSAKWRTIEQKKDINLLVVGTSLIWSGVLPPILDSASDFKVRSYNFGISMLNLPYSTDILIDRLGSGNNTIKYVIVELGGIHLETHKVTRSLEFHLNKSVMGTEQTLRHIFWDLQIFWHEHIGLKPEVLALTKRITPAKGTGMINFPEFDENGYSLIPAKNEPNRKVVLRYSQTTRVKYREAMSSTSSFHTSNLQELSEKFAKKGAKLLFILPPIMAEANNYFAVESFKSLRDDQKLTIDTTTHFRLIEDASLFKDNLHFNYQGAEFYSFLLGSALKDYLDHFEIDPGGDAVKGSIETNP